MHAIDMLLVLVIILTILLHNHLMRLSKHSFACGQVLFVNFRGWVDGFDDSR